MPDRNTLTSGGGSNVHELKSVFEDAEQDCLRYAGAEFEDDLALLHQDVALGAQMQALISLAELNSTGLDDVLVKFEVWKSNHDRSEIGALSPQSDALIRSIHADLVRISGK